MIGYINGTIAAMDENTVVLDHGGLGFNIFIPSSFAQTHGVGEEVRIYTYLSVREDAITLFGFESADEQKMFRLLITVNGIGPKAALSILSVLPADELRIAILTSDTARIAKAPGIGKKTAEKAVLELRDKFSMDDILDGAGTDQTVSGAARPGIDSDAVEALIALGYSGSSALSAVKKAEAETGSGETETLIKAALKYLF